MPDLERWRSTWKDLGAEAPASLYDTIVARYAEPQRRYHTLQHLDECFAHFDEARHLAGNAAEVALALWFHDAVYNVKAQDNELRSADWARAVAVEHGFLETADRVHALVMATKHDATPTLPDAALLIDVDLAILGAPGQRFDEYERQVREEYSWVPGFLFRPKRRQILEAFLARPYIYSTEHFRARLEAPARENLARSINLLR